MWVLKGCFASEYFYRKWRRSGAFIHFECIWQKQFCWGYLPCVHHKQRAFYKGKSLDTWNCVNNCWRPLFFLKLCVCSLHTCIIKWPLAFIMLMVFYTDEQKLKNKPRGWVLRKALYQLWATRWFPSGSGTLDKDSVAGLGPYLRLSPRTYLL